MKFFTIAASSLFGLASFSAAITPPEVSQDHPILEPRGKGKHLFDHHQPHKSTCKHARQNCMMTTKLSKDRCTKILKRAGVCWDYSDMERDFILPSNYDLWNHITVMPSSSTMTLTKEGDKLITPTSSSKPKTTVMIPEEQLSKKPASSAATKKDSGQSKYTITTSMEIVVTRPSSHSRATVTVIDDSDVETVTQHIRHSTRTIEVGTKTITNVPNPAPHLEKRKGFRNPGVCRFCRRHCREEMHYSDKKCRSLVQPAGICLTKDQKKAFKEQRDNGSAGQPNAFPVPIIPLVDDDDENFAQLERREEDYDEDDDEDYDQDLEVHLAETMAEHDQLIVPSVGATKTVSIDNSMESTQNAISERPNLPLVTFVVDESLYEQNSMDDEEESLYKARLKEMVQDFKVEDDKSESLSGPVTSTPAGVASLATLVTEIRKVHSEMNAAARTMSRMIPTPEAVANSVSPANSMVTAMPSLIDPLGFSENTNAPQRMFGKRWVKHKTCMRLLKDCVNHAVPRVPGVCVEKLCKNWLCLRCWAECFQNACDPPCKKNGAKGWWRRCDFKDYGPPRSCYVEEDLTITLPLTELDYQSSTPTGEPSHNTLAYASRWSSSKTPKSTRPVSTEFIGGCPPV